MMTDQPKPPDLEITDNVPAGLRVTGDQPYHILVVSDFTGSEAGSVAGSLSEGVVNVTADTFDKMMAAAAPSVSYTTTDPLASGNAMAEVNLRFDSLKAFEPRRVIEQIPPAKSLMEVRTRIVSRMRGKITAAELTQAVGRMASADAGLSWLTESIKWSPKEPAADPGAVDGLLGQLDLGDEKVDDDSPPPRSPIGAVVAAAAGDGASIPAEEASALRRTLAETDRRLSTWLTTVLHAPQVQSLEAAWRTLAFLVSHINFRKGVRLSILHAPTGQLLERFNSRVIDPVFDEGADAPHLIMVDTAFGNTAADLEALDELAQHGASLPAIVLAGVSPQFFGVKHAWQMATLPAVSNMFDQWQFAKWKTLRNQPYATALGVVFGRGLLRTLYGRGDAGDLEFAYKEECLADKDLVWANGPVVAACTVAKSVAETGWPTAVSGYIHGQVEGFKTAEGGKKGDKKFGPSDTELVDTKIEELGIAGINAAVVLRESDTVLLWNGMTAAQSQRDAVSSVFGITLPYQLFASRISSLLFELKPHLSGMTAEQVVPFVTQHVREWVAFDGEPTPDQLTVQVRPAEDNPMALDMAVTVTPPQSHLPGGIPVVMGYRLK